MPKNVTNNNCECRQDSITTDYNLMSQQQKLNKPKSPQLIYKADNLPPDTQESTVYKLTGLVNPSRLLFKDANMPSIITCPCCISCNKKIKKIDKQ
jgi:hypothetical protein